MRFLFSFLPVVAAALIFTLAAQAQSLLENGDFKNSTDPFKGWVTDYAWTKNHFYVENKDRLTVATDGARKCVNFGDAYPSGVKMESRAFPLEPGFKYICTLAIKGEAYRAYFAGYQWVPGIRPHDNPELSELRMIYQSKPLKGENEEWTEQKFELPGVVLSDDAKTYLKKVRYLTIYIWMAKPGSIANVTLTKVPDPAMNF